VSTVTVPAPTPAASPAVAPEERIDVLDALRGFALAGILAVNVLAFGRVAGAPPDFFTALAPADRVVQVLIVLLVESKFFTLFSFLFGLGVALQVTRARARRASVVPRLVRRLTALLAFGVAHVVLLWEGDILVLYAVLGGVLLLMRNVSDRMLLRWAVALLAVPAVLTVVALAGLAVARGLPGAAEALAQADTAVPEVFAADREAALRVLRDGGYPELVEYRLGAYPVTAALLTTRAPVVLAMFLLGLYAGRSGIAARVGDHGELLRRVAVRWLPIGLVVQVAVVVGTQVAPPATALPLLFLNQFLTGPVLALGYAAVFVLAARTRVGARALGWLRWPGRTALSCYLGASAAMAAVFWGIGWGFAGGVGAPAALGVAAAIVVAQALLARAWLTAFRYGPLEWLWRCATHWQRVPLRRSA
jgi:uncharacterized protein